MINKSDAIAVLQQSLSARKRSSLLDAVDAEARRVLDSIFAERERISNDEARTAHWIITRVSTALLGAITVARQSGDIDDEEEERLP